MTRRRSERSRWTQVFFIGEPDESTAAAYTRAEYQKARAIIVAFSKLGRVVRVEPSEHGAGLVFKARKA